MVALQAAAVFRQSELRRGAQKACFQAVQRESQCLCLCNLGGAGWQPGGLQRPSYER